MDITLVYVDKDNRPLYQTLAVADGTTIADALALSGWLDLAQLNWFKDWLNHTPQDTPPIHKAWFVGVFSVKKPLNYVLNNGDRVEIYRPLALDPMKNRLTKAKISQKQKALAIQAKNIAKKDERKKTDNGESSAY